MLPKEIPDIDFGARRTAFVRRMPRSVAVLTSAPEAIRNSDVHHPYRQESGFYYLTGLSEPGSLALFAPQAKNPFQLFVRPRSKERELWEGKSLGPEGAKLRLGADAAFPSTPGGFFDEEFQKALVEADALYYRVGIDPELDRRIFALMERARRQASGKGRPLWPILDPGGLLGELRLTKHRPEVARLETAGNITAEAHVNAMRVTKPGMYEYEIEAVLTHAFRAMGAGRAGYQPIVASGPNACVLHYHENSRRLTDRDLVLVDAGAEFDYYTADVTRTFPASGKFSPESREIYAAVLEVQKMALKQARPGKTVRDIHEATVEGLVEVLRRLKVLRGQTRSLIKKREYLPYFPHATAHWLGMDVHDAGPYYQGDYQSPRKLAPGMVIAVEPALYFASDGPSPARYKGLGVRIEDDVLITSRGGVVLTAGAPKEIEEIETLCSQN